MDRQLFDYGRPLAGVLNQSHDRIKAAIRAEPESFVVNTDAERWAAHLAEKNAADPPVLVMEQLRVEDLGERQVNATGMAGVSFTSMEWGRAVIRPGLEVQLVIPVIGDAELLRYGPSGGAPTVEADIEAGSVYRRWNWPHIKGPDALSEEIERLNGQLMHGAEKVAAEIARHNAALEDFTAEAIAERRAELARHSGFLAALRVPVARRADAPKPF